MKRIWITLLVLTLCLSLCACAGGQGNPASTEAPTTDGIPAGTEPTEEQTPQLSTEAPLQTQTPEDSEAPAEETMENSAFTAQFPVCNDTVLAFLYNAPFTNGEMTPSEIWVDGAYDQLVIVPRYRNMKVEAYAVSINEEGYPELAAEPSYTAISDAGTAIFASLSRPEGFPAWYVCVEAEDGSYAGMYLEYNGRYGTPRYEFLEDVYASSLIEVPSGMEDWNSQMEMIGYETFWSFWRAATRNGMDAWEAAELCYSALTELGDGAAFTMYEGGDMDGDTCSFSCARLHSAYCDNLYDRSLAEIVQGQYALYGQIGNERGILGPSYTGEAGELYFTLTGLTVFNPSLAATEVQVTVNGIDAGTYSLEEGDFCTLLPLSLPDFPADAPVQVLVRVTGVRYGTPEEAIIEVYPGLGGNISGAL